MTTQSSHPSLTARPAVVGVIVKLLMWPPSHTCGLFRFRPFLKKTSIRTFLAAAASSISKPRSPSFASTTSYFVSVCGGGGLCHCPPDGFLGAACQSLNARKNSMLKVGSGTKKPGASRRANGRDVKLCSEMLLPRSTAATACLARGGNVDMFGIDRGRIL